MPTVESEPSRSLPRSLAERCSVSAGWSLFREVALGEPGNRFNISMIPDGLKQGIEFEAKEFDLNPDTSYNSKFIKNEDGVGRVGSLKGLPILVEQSSANKQNLETWVEARIADQEFIEEFPRAFFAAPSHGWMIGILREVLTYWQQSKKMPLTQGIKLIVLNYLLQARITISKDSIKDQRCFETHMTEPPLSRLATHGVKGMVWSCFEVAHDDVLRALDQSLGSDQHDITLCLLILFVLCIAGIQIAVVEDPRRDKREHDAREEINTLENRVNELMGLFYSLWATSKPNDATRDLVEKLNSWRVENLSSSLNVHDIAKEAIAFDNEPRLLSKLLDLTLSK